MKKTFLPLVPALLLAGCVDEDSINQAAHNGLESMGYRETRTQALLHMRCRPGDYAAANFEALDNSNRYVAGTFCIHKIDKAGFRDARPLSFTILTRTYAEPSQDQPGATSAP